MHELIVYLLSLSNQMGYGGIILLMAIESSFLPLPSELIIPPAAYLAAQGEMNIYLIVLSGAIGSVIGASFNYFLALTLGRKIVYAMADHQIAKVFFINKQKNYGELHPLCRRHRMRKFLGRC